MILVALIWSVCNFPPTVEPCSESVAGSRVVVGSWVESGGYAARKDLDKSKKMLLFRRTFRLRPTCVPNGRDLNTGQQPKHVTELHTSPAQSVLL